MKTTRVIVLALISFLTFTSLARADECPYCHQYYPPAAPGDESRVNGLRRLHEDGCPDNPKNKRRSSSQQQSSGSSDVSSGYGAVTIFNATNGPVSYQWARTSDANWSKVETIQPGESHYFWQSEPAYFQIHVQGTSYRLEHNHVTWKPRWFDGREYAFVDSGNGIGVNYSSGRIQAEVDRQAQVAAEQRRQALEANLNRGDEAWYARDYRLAKYWYKQALTQSPGNIEIQKLITNADQQMRRADGCTDRSNKALAAYNQKNWDSAIQLWREALNYCDQVAVLNENIRKAEQQKSLDSEMLAANKSGNASMAKGDVVAAYHEYKRALELRPEQGIVKLNLQLAEQECNQRMGKANDTGNKLFAKDRYLDAAVAYWKSLQYVLQPEKHRKIIFDNLVLALKQLNQSNPELFEEASKLDTEQLEQTYAGLNIAAPPAGVAGNGKPPRESLTDQDVDRIRKGIQKTFGVNPEDFDPDGLRGRQN